MNIPLGLVNKEHLEMSRGRKNTICSLSNLDRDSAAGRMAMTAAQGDLMAARIN